MADRAYTEDLKNSDCGSWLKAYIDHQRHSESPIQFHFWTGVATLAGALRRKVWIDQRHFQWTPNMYIVLCGPPGVAAKSTSLRAGLSLLEGVKDVKLGPASTTWQALIKSLSDSHQTFTPTGSDQPLKSCSLTIGVAELGTFLDPQNREMVDWLTHMWDGQKEVFRREIKLDGMTTLYNPWVNLIACTTPSWLKANFPEGLIGGGLTSRIVFVYGDKKRQLIAYPSREIESETYKDEELCLLHDLKQIAELCGEYKLTEEAFEWGDAWYRHHLNGGLPAHLASSRFEGYVHRKQAHVHKLAIVFAASQRNELVITKADLIAAEEHMTALEKDMLTVFSSIGVSTAANITSEVVKSIQNYKSIELKALWRLHMGTLDVRSFEESIRSAILAGEVKKEGSGDTMKLIYMGGKR